MARAPFPQDMGAFGDDERISFDRVENKFTLVDENDETWEFNETSGRWHQPVSQYDLSVQRFNAGTASCRAPP